MFFAALFCVYVIFETQNRRQKKNLTTPEVTKLESKFYLFPG